LSAPTKETVRALLDRLPDDCTIGDVLYHLYVLNTVAEGKTDADRGYTVTHVHVAEELRQKWGLGAK
jgi:hypothetical protein